jgi:hypothetical protein
MKKLSKIIYLILMISLYSCGAGDSGSTNSDGTGTDADTDDTTNGEVIDSATSAGVSFSTVKFSCLRWLDRNIYFADQNPIIEERNNFFHKDAAKEALRLLELITNLGKDYFNFKDTKENLLNLTPQGGLPEEDVRSFFQFWEDTKFDAYVADHFGGDVENLSDPNFIEIIHPQHKRKYGVAFRSSCFNGESTCITKDDVVLSPNGVSALVLRAIGKLFRLPAVDCSVDATAVMCKEANNTQFTNETLLEFVAVFNGQLKLITENGNFYEDAVSKGGCQLDKWMDDKLFFAFSNGSTDRNTRFATDAVKDALNEIAENSLLKKDYFSYILTNEADLPLFTEPIEIFGAQPSFYLVWDTSTFNGFVRSELNGIIPDPNGFTILDVNNKRKFQTILSNSCFFTETINGQTFSLCGPTGIGLSHNKGVRALIARQLGVLVGMEFADCNTAPLDTMCADNPSDAQWESPNRERWLNEFNNYLELVNNLDNFYP